MNAVEYFFKNNKNKDIMVIDGENSITYSEGYQKIEKISQYLNENIGENKKIVLMCENSIYFIIAYLSIIKSGNICIPINPKMSVDNLEYILSLVYPKMIFTTQRNLSKLKKYNIKLLSEKDLFEIEENIKIRSPIENKGVFDDKKLAEIIFTSGSSAFPKGVMLTHKNIMENTNSIIEYLKLTSKDTIEVVLPFFYCYGLSLLHTHTKVGGKIVINNRFLMVDSIIEDIKKYNCTGFAGVPSHYQILLRSSNKFKNSNLSSLRYATVAGGKLHNPLIKEFTKTFPKIDFYVMYGQTEATARLSYLEPKYLDTKIGSLGKGIPNVKLKVINSKKKEVIPGETGEIVAKGENIMKGYYEDKKSSEKVLKNGWLHTGDLATIDKDGFIYIVGRTKSIIKVGGERVSPTEIEGVIMKIPEVLDCSVIGVEDNLLGEAIKVFVLTKNNSSLKREDIKDYCINNLNPLKVPKYIQLVDKIPMNETGKKVKDEIKKLHNQGKS